MHSWHLTTQRRCTLLFTRRTDSWESFSFQNRNVCGWKIMMSTRGQNPAPLPHTSPLIDVKLIWERFPNDSLLFTISHEHDPMQTIDKNREILTSTHLKRFTRLTYNPLAPSLGVWRSMNNQENRRMKNISKQLIFIPLTPTWPRWDFQSIVFVNLLT